MPEKCGAVPEVGRGQGEFTEGVGGAVPEGCGAFPDPTVGPRDRISASEASSSHSPPLHPYPPFPQGNEGINSSSASATLGAETAVQTFGAETPATFGATKTLRSFGAETLNPFGSGTLNPFGAESPRSSPAQPSSAPHYSALGAAHEMKPRPMSTDVMGAHPTAREHKSSGAGVGRANERVFGGESSWLQILSQKLEAGGGDENVRAGKAGVGGKLSKKEQYRIAVEQAKVQMQTGMTSLLTLY